MNNTITNFYTHSQIQFILNCFSYLDKKDTNDDLINKSLDFIQNDEHKKEILIIKSLDFFCNLEKKENKINLISFLNTFLSFDNKISFFKYQLNVNKINDDDYILFIQNFNEKNIKKNSQIICQILENYCNNPNILSTYTITDNIFFFNEIYKNKNNFILKDVSKIITKYIKEQSSFDYILEPKQFFNFLDNLKHFYIDENILIKDISKNISFYFGSTDKRNSLIKSVKDNDFYKNIVFYSYQNYIKNLEIGYQEQFLEEINIFTEMNKIFSYKKQTDLFKSFEKIIKQNLKYGERDIKEHVINKLSVLKEKVQLMNEIHEKKIKTNIKGNFKI